MLLVNSYKNVGVTVYVFLLVLMVQVAINTSCQNSSNPPEHVQIKPQPLLPDTVTCLSIAEQKILAGSQKKALAHNNFLCQAKQLFYDLQHSDIAAVQEQASDYGLGTFLYLDIERIDSFMIVDFKINGNDATARIQLNDFKNPATCYFSKKNDTLWVFNRIEAAGMRRAVLLK